MEPKENAHLPRILCLHGGGSNAFVMEAQCRAIIFALKDKFRLCFAQGPFHAEAGPDVLFVYGEFGPFHGWTPPEWLAVAAEQHRHVSGQEVISKVGDALQRAMDADDDAGGTGPWVGILGFSQGAKVSASLLLHQQENMLDSPFNFRFGVIMAGRGPPVLTEELKNLMEAQAHDDCRLRLPTLHVHGLLDPGLEVHRRMFRQWFEPGSAKLVEWDGNHRLPFKKADVTAVVESLLAVAAQAGVPVDARKFS